MCDPPRQVCLAFCFAPVCLSIIALLYRVCVTRTACTRSNSHISQFAPAFVLTGRLWLFLLYFSSRLHVESLDTNSRGFSYLRIRVFAALPVLVKLPTFLSLRLFLCLLAALRCFYPVLSHIFCFRFVLLQQRFLNIFICAGWSLCVILLGRFA